MKAVVIATGMKTEIGQIQQASNEAEQGESPLKAKLNKLGQQFGIASLVASITIFVIIVTTERGKARNIFPFPFFWKFILQLIV